MLSELVDLQKGYVALMKVVIGYPAPEHFSRKCAPACGLAMRQRLTGAGSTCWGSFRRQSV